MFKELIQVAVIKFWEKMLSVFVKICPIPAKALEYYQITAKLDAFDISSLNTNAKINLMWKKHDFKLRLSSHFVTIATYLGL